MLSARNAQLAAQKFLGPAVTVGKGDPFVRGYDNVTGGTAAISNFNAMMQPGGPGTKLVNIFYGELTWAIYNDAIGAMNQQIVVIAFDDLAGASYAQTLNVMQTLGARPLIPCETIAGITQGVFASQVFFASRCTLHFSGYIYPIS